MNAMHAKIVSITLQIPRVKRSRHVFSSLTELMVRGAAYFMEHFCQFFLLEKS